MRIENCDNENRSHIVNDRQRGKKYPGASRCMRSNQSECSKSKSDIGRHRDAPAPRVLPAHVPHPVDCSRDNHPADRARNWNSSFPYRRQFAYY
ncbi:MAG: hypothetical protein Udaeo2_16470 [Candidatus Udaeobacter sp.]|nr:MAG: hypothetical protein Udaeo2_16470 [Candidatus Udaeobacter sp.]